MAAIGDRDRYLEILRQNPAELDLLAKDLLINVTSFFRDPKAFELLAEQIIPDLVRRHEAGPAVADLGGRLQHRRRDLFDRDALRRGNRRDEADDLAAGLRLRCRRRGGGVCPRGGLSGLDRGGCLRRRGSPASLRSRTGLTAIVPELRGLVVFTTQNVLADPPFSRLDLVSCRNLLIYLRPEAQEKVLLLFDFALREGGILFLGGAETVAALDDRFEPISKAHRIYRHIGHGGPTRADFPFGSNMRVRLARRAAGAAWRQPARADAAGAARRLRAGLGPDQSARASVCITRDRPTAICGWPPASPAATCSRWCATGCAASSGRRSAQASARSRASHRHRRAGEPRRRLGRGDHRGAAAAQRRRGPAAGQLPRRARAGRARWPVDRCSAEAGSRVAELERELDATRKELQSAIRDLEIANEEQTAINEEAMSVNEEFQSTNEELVTSKEELQALNEELTALNSQLQETLDRQRSTSDDLQNILDSTGVATLFLDRRSQHPLLHAGGDIAVPHHRHRYRPAAGRPDAARGRYRSSRPMPARCLPGSNRSGARSRPRAAPGTTAASCPTAPRTTGSTAWSSPSPTSPR